MMSYEEISYVRSSICLSKIFNPEFRIRIKNYVKFALFYHYSIEQKYIKYVFYQVESVSTFSTGSNTERVGSVSGFLN